MWRSVLTPSPPMSGVRTTSRSTDSASIGLFRSITAGGLTGS